MSLKWQYQVLVDFRNLIFVHFSITHWKCEIFRRAAYSCLCFILVIIQRSTEKRRLHFRTLSTNQMRPAVTLTAFHHASECEKEHNLSIQIKGLKQGYMVLVKLAVAKHSGNHSISLSKFFFALLIINSNLFLVNLQLDTRQFVNWDKCVHLNVIIDIQ